VIRLGLIGAGPWGRVYINTCAGLTGARLTMIASRNPDTAALAPTGCRVTPDWHTLIHTGALDGLIIATPPTLHAEMASAAIEAGIPVLIEKPLTMDAAQAHVLLDLAKTRGVLTMVDHTQLHLPAYEALKARAQALGPVTAIRSSGGNHGPFRAGISALWDYGPHDVSLCLDLLGEKPSSIQAEDLQAPGPGRNFRLTLGFPSGANAVIEVGNAFLSKRRRFEAYVDKQALVFSGAAPQSLTIHDVNDSTLGPGRPIAVSDELPLTRVVNAFTIALSEGSTDLSGLAFGVDVVDILAACETSLAGG